MKKLTVASKNGIHRLDFLKAIVGTAAIANTLPAQLLAADAKSSNQNTGAAKDPKRPIVDRLERAERYFNLHPLFEKAFAFLRRPGLAKLAVGKHAVDGDRLYCLVSQGPGRPRTEARLEAHRKYIDIQYVVSVSGSEEMGWKPTADCKEIDQDYDPEKDIMFFKDKPQRWVKVAPGFFAVFFPRDAHAPLVSKGENHKVVLKIAVE